MTNTPSNNNETWSNTGFPVHDWVNNFDQSMPQLVFGHGSSCVLSLSVERLVPNLDEAQAPIRMLHLDVTHPAQAETHWYKKCITKEQVKEIGAYFSLLAGLVEQEETFQLLEDLSFITEPEFDEDPEFADVTLLGDGTIGFSLEFQDNATFLRLHIATESVQFGEPNLSWASWLFFIQDLEKMSDFWWELAARFDSDIDQVRSEAEARTARPNARKKKPAAKKAPSTKQTEASDKKSKDLVDKDDIIKPIKPNPKGNGDEKIYGPR